MVLSYEMKEGQVVNAGYGRRKELITFFSKIKAQEWPNFRQVA